MIRQTDDVRTSDRCRKPTIYQIDEGKRYKQIKTCIYFRDGACSLTACVRKGDQNDAEIYS